MMRIFSPPFIYGAKPIEWRQALALKDAETVVGSDRLAWAPGYLTHVSELRSDSPGS